MVVYLFLSRQSSQVESQLFTLQDVTITSAGLTWSGRDSSVQLTRTKLSVNSGLDRSRRGSGSQLSLDLSGLLGDFFFGTLGLLTQSVAVVRLVPLSERSGVDLHDGSLGQGVSSDQLVVGRVVNNPRNSGLLGDTLGGPREVTRLDSQGSELAVSSSGSDGVDSLSSQSGVGSASAQLELSLFSELGSFGTGG